MRKIFQTLVLLSALLSIVQLATAGTVQLIGTVHSPSGNNFNGSIKIVLPFAGAVDTNCPGNCAIAPAITAIPIVNGAPVGGFLVRNADIQPHGTYYRAVLYNSFGAPISTYNFVIPAGGTTFDIGAALITNVTTSNVSLISPADLSGNNTWLGNQTFNGNVTFLGLVLFSPPNVRTICQSTDTITVTNAQSNFPILSCTVPAGIFDPTVNHLTILVDMQVNARNAGNVSSLQIDGVNICAGVTDDGNVNGIYHYYAALGPSPSVGANTLTGFDTSIGNSGTAQVSQVVHNCTIGALNWATTHSITLKQTQTVPGAQTTWSNVQVIMN